MKCWDAWDVDLCVLQTLKIFFLFQPANPQPTSYFGIMSFDRETLHTNLVTAAQELEAALDVGTWSAIVDVYFRHVSGLSAPIPVHQTDFIFRRQEGFGGPMPGRRKSSFAPPTCGAMSSALSRNSKTGCLVGTTPPLWSGGWSCCGTQCSSSRNKLQRRVPQRRWQHPKQGPWQCLFRQ